MEDEQRTQFIRNTFDTVCERYGQGPLRFFQYAADHLPGLLELQGNEQILDAAAGTGLASTVLASRVPQGKVTAIDLSEGMLAKARARAHSMQLDNIEYQQMDMTRLPFPDNSYDIINSSFGLFFVEDIESLSQHLVSKLKPGGRLITTHFAAGSFAPMSELFRQRMEKYDVEVPILSWNRLENEQLNKTLYQNVGLDNIRQQRNQVGYFFSNADEWWDVVWWAGYRGFVEQVSSDKLEQCKQEHLDEISRLATDDGIWFNVELIHTIGEKN